MPIAFDVASVAGGGSSITSLTWPHTCSGDNLFLFVSTEAYSGSNPTGVTYNGVALTNLWVQEPSNHKGSAWYLVAPTTGEHNVVVTWATSQDYVAAGAASYTGVHQTTPIGTPVSTYVYDISISVNVSSAVGEWVLDAISCGKPDAIIGAGQTQRYVDSKYDQRTIHSTKDGATSVTMSWTWTGNAWFSLGAVPIKPAVEVLTPRSLHRLRSRPLRSPTFKPSSTSSPTRFNHSIRSPRSKPILKIFSRCWSPHPWSRRSKLILPLSTPWRNRFHPSRI